MPGLFNLKPFPPPLLVGRQHDPGQRKRMARMDPVTSRPNKPQDNQLGLTYDAIKDERPMMWPQQVPDEYDAAHRRPSKPKTHSMTVNYGAVGRVQSTGDKNAPNLPTPAFSSKRRKWHLRLMNFRAADTG